MGTPRSAVAELSVQIILARFSAIARTNFGKKGLARPCISSRILSYITPAPNQVGVGPSATFRLPKGRKRAPRHHASRLSADDATILLCAALTGLESFGAFRGGDGMRLRGPGE